MAEDNCSSWLNPSTLLYVFIPATDSNFGSAIDIDTNLDVSESRRVIAQDDNI
jgi:hypothetical protein